MVEVLRDRVIWSLEIVLVIDDPLKLCLSIRATEHLGCSIDLCAFRHLLLHLYGFGVSSFLIKLLDFYMVFLKFVSFLFVVWNDISVRWCYFSEVLALSLVWGFGSEVRSLVHVEGWVVGLREMSRRIMVEVFLIEVVLWIWGNGVFPYLKVLWRGLFCKNDGWLRDFVQRWLSWRLRDGVFLLHGDRAWLWFCVRFWEFAWKSTLLILTEIGLLWAAIYWGAVEDSLVLEHELLTFLSH